MKLKKFLEMMLTDDIIVAIPPEIIHQNQTLQKFFEKHGGYSKIDTTNSLIYYFDQYLNHILAILQPDAFTSYVKTLPLFENKEALKIILNLNTHKIATHLDENEREMIVIILK